MIGAVTLVVFSFFVLNNAHISVINHNNSEIFKSCISNIIKKYFSNYSDITFLDIHYDDDEIYEAIHSVRAVNVFLRNKIIGMTRMDESYIIASLNTNTILNIFKKLNKEASWNPNAKFLLIIKNLIQSELKLIFDILMKSHVINILVLNGNPDPDLYTYNPYENYGCGRRYDRIIEYGKCSLIKSKNLYPYKLVTGLRNCTLRVTSPHWPPYTIDPSRRNTPQIGVEEFIFRQMSALEHFSVEIQYSDDAEIFTLITSDMAAVGPMKLIQTDDTDAVYGGMILTHPRAQAFSYVYGHLSNTDEIRYQVQKALPVPFWRYMYLEFNFLVWVMFLVTFITFFSIFTVLVKPKDKIGVIFTMFRYLLLVSVKAKGNYYTKCLFLVWIWFAYLINTYYVSSFVSLVTHRPTSYQISNENDLYDFNLKPCISNLMRSYLLSVENMTLGKNEGNHCGGLLESIQTVSRSSDVYTVVLYSIYDHRKDRFYDNFGKSRTYSFKKPISKIVYAIYLYKGFPISEKLTMHAVRLRETGLIDNHLKYLNWHSENKGKFCSEVKMPFVIVPWQILIVGYVVCGTVFLLEVVINKLHITRKLSSRRNV